MSQKIMNPLPRKATLVSVDISQWTARKLDKKITREVNQSHGASDDAGRYNKLLIEAKRLARINSLVSQARDLHYRLTKPWADQGLRILPNALHAKFANEFRVLKRDFEEAVDEFCADYPMFVEERRRALNGLFNEQDYPSSSEIREKFSLNTKTFPVPDTEDFRSDVLDADMIADIKRDLEETTAQVLDGARKDTLQQVATIVGHMSEKLKAYKTDKSFFTGSLVENVRELAELLPAFNLTDDPQFDLIADRIKRELCVEEAATLRESAEARASVQKSADEILADVSSLLG
jgi:Protein of unknown function (DUF3150)